MRLRIGIGFKELALTANKLLNYENIYKNVKLPQGQQYKHIKILLYLPQDTQSRGR